MQTTFKNFKVVAEYKGDKAWGTDDEYTYKNTNNHLVTVTNTETKESCDFDYWTSLARPEMTSEQDVLEAFECFLDDSLAAIQNKDEWDFFDEFGYEPSRKAKQIYEACKKSAEKCKRVVGSEDDIVDLANELQEKLGW